MNLEIKLRERHLCLDHQHRQETQRRARATAETQTAGQNGKTQIATQYRDTYQDRSRSRISYLDTSPDNNNRDYCISIHPRICSRLIRYFPEYESSAIIIIRREQKFVRREHDSAELSSRIRHPSKSLLPSDRPATLSLLALWKVSSLFPFPNRHDLK